MSELLDKQVYVLNEYFKYKFPGVTKAHEKCAMKIKERKKKKTTAAYNFFYWKDDFIRLYQKTGWSDFDELWVTDSTLNEGTNSLINERKGAGQMVRRALSQNEHHKTRNG